MYPSNGSLVFFWGAKIWTLQKPNSVEHNGDHRPTKLPIDPIEYDWMFYEHKQPAKGRHSSTFNYIHSIYYMLGIPSYTKKHNIHLCILSTEINMEPENTPLEEDNHEPNQHFQVRFVHLRGVNPLKKTRRYSYHPCMVYLPTFTMDGMGYTAIFLVFVMWSIGKISPHDTQNRTSRLVKSCLLCRDLQGGKAWLKFPWI